VLIPAAFPPTIRQCEPIPERGVCGGYGLLAFSVRGTAVW